MRAMVACDQCLHVHCADLGTFKHMFRFKASSNLLTAGAAASAIEPKLWHSWAKQWPRICEIGLFTLADK